MMTAPPRPHAVLLVLLWLLVQAGIWWSYGTVTGLEAEKYIAAARHIIESGDFPERKYLFYALTPLLIAASLKLGAGFSGAVCGQLLLNAVSTAFFYRLLRALTRSDRAALAGTAALILFLPYQTWNVYLYTESLFLSFIPLLLYAAYRFSEKQNNARGIALLLCLAGVVCARPFGLLFLPALALYGMRLLPFRLRLLSLVLAAAALGLMYLALNRAFAGSMDWNALLPNERGETICDVPDPALQQPLQLARAGNPVDQLFYYIIHNPGHYLRLSALRLRAFLLPTRDWYSTAHNLFLIGWIALLYAGLIAGIRPLRRLAPPAFRLLLAGMLAGYTAAITLQCDDYHNRFLMALIPLLILAGSAALTRLPFMRSSSAPPPR